MVPTPQELAEGGEVASPSPNGQRVVISGISGIYPQLHHIKELSETLYNKGNPLAEPNPRWIYDNPEVPPCVGVMPDLDKFDAQFFKVHYHLCCSMDTMARKILEQSYQAIYDAGVNPEHLSGKKIGVYIGSCLSETEKATFYGATSGNGFGIAGCNKSMFANRISYWLNAKGPSQAIDAACCSSTVALEQAYLAMTRGDCEAAIVGGANVCLHPQTSFHYGRTIPLCKDGKTKSYDQNADGCVRSEAINVLFLQKASDALRIYADVVHVKNFFVSLEQSETGQKYGFSRNLDATTGFLRSFYEEAKVSPNEVEYIEGLGAAEAEADKVELDAYDKVFCSNRAEPLPVGSVVSNIGYCEAASGISAITKVVLGYHTGEMAGNLHYTNPRDDVAGLREGRLQVLSDKQPIKRTYVGINGLSITGINSHVLLHGSYKPKDLTKYQCNIPRLVMISARQDSAVKNMIVDLKSRPIDPEELALLQNIHSSKISGHLGRGYVILDTDKENKTVVLCDKVDYFDGSDRPLWFVYSGMGSQWATMGASLMRIPIFSAAIERCRIVLEPKGIDIVDIITSPDKTIYDNILHSFVGIAAVQIGLTDILHALGMFPDKIIGHSVGELGCAYADGCLTAEEMILAAYSRGLVSIQTPFIRGSMAAVGIAFEEVSKMCPPEIEVACHNGPDSSTISGPADAMTEFVAQLTAKGIFAKEVPCSNIAYHSRYIAEAGPGLLKYLTEVIKTPKLRSEKWVSTSVPQERWEEDAAKYSSAEYHTNNLLSPVLFEETSRLIPATAVLVEVAPHGLLQAILKRSLPASCAHVPLTRRGHADNARFLLEAIGKLYMEGYFPDIRALYPKVEFPVSTGTPHLSHLVEWAHNESWLLPLYAGAKRTIAATCTFVTSVHDIENKYLNGHKIKGKTLYPFAGALVAAWDTLAMLTGGERKQVAVQFRDVHLFSQPVLHDSRQLRLSITLQRGTGLFEVINKFNNGSKVASGYVMVKGKKKKTDEVSPEAEEETENNTMALSSEDIYQMFSDRCYTYGGEFRSILNSNESFTEGQLLWTGNWVTLIDGMLQLNALREAHEGVSQPIYIRKMEINPEIKPKKETKTETDTAAKTETETEAKTETEIETVADDAEVTQKPVKINICPLQDYTSCGGVVMENVRFHNIDTWDENTIGLKVLKFVPRFPVRNNLNINQITQVFMQTVHENIDKEELNVIEIYDNENADASVFGKIQKATEDLIDIKSNFTKIHRKNLVNSLSEEADLVLIQKLSTDDNMCKSLYEILKQNTYVISAEDLNEDLNRVRPKALYNIVSAHNTDSTRFELVQWRPRPATATSAFNVRTNSDLVLLQKTRVNLPSQQKIIIFASYPPVSGLKDIIKQWRREPGRNQVHLLTIKDKISEDLFMDQLPDLDLAFNIVSRGEVGGEYYVPLQEKPSLHRGVTLKSARIGDLKSLQWVETSGKAESGIPVKVHFAGLNAYDAARAAAHATLKIDDSINEGHYGMDFSGTTKNGQRVMGLVRGGALSDRVAARPELLWPVPEHWSLEDAATVPLPYAHAYYCLAIKSQVMPGMSVLVSGGAGAIGQAVISIALHLECRIFVVVSDMLKKRFLLRLFPNLKDEYVICCRDESFVDSVLTMTSGNGCDIVICGKGESKNGYLKCSGILGVTLDIDQVKSNNNYMLGMNDLGFDRSYVRIDFSSLLDTINSGTVKELQWMISEGILSGVVRPLSRVTYAPDEAPRAFRLLAASRHRGRVLLRMQPAPPPVQPRIVCSAQQSQLLLCDDEGLAIHLADRLIKRGARKIHLHSATFSARFSHALKSWQQLGVKVQISSENIADNKTASNLLIAASHMGPVESVFVMITRALTDQTRPVYQSLVVNLDTATRKLCPSIKYFAVVGTDTPVGQHTCLARANDRLSAMMLSLPNISKVNSDLETSAPVNRREIIDAIEQGLRSEQPVLQAHKLPAKDQPSLLQQIITAAGVKITEDTPQTASLRDLGLTSDGAHDVSILFKINQDLSIDKEKVPFFTLQGIRDIEKDLKETDFSPKQGLSAIFSYIDTDELQATAEMVPMRTRTSTSKQRDDEFDANQTFLCILPGFEGHYRRFQLMCERLKVAAIVLQPGLDNPNESVHKMAERFAKVYLKKIGNKNFYIAGYEMGAMMALEMAAILEDNGLTGTVFCLGGGPDEFLVELEEQLHAAVGGGAGDAQALQDAVARHMWELMSGGSSTELEAALCGASNWQQKVEACVRALRGRVAHSAQYTRALIEAAYMRMANARQHAQALVQSVPRALRSRVVLLRSPTPRSLAPSAGAHPLQRYSQKPLEVFDLRAPLSRATDDLRVTALINQLLDEEILKEFDSKNLCDTYILNALDFVGNNNKTKK